MPVGSGLAALLVPSAIGLIGWRGPSVADAGLAAAVLLAVLRWVPATGVRGRAANGGLLGAFRSPSVVIITVVFGLYAAQYLAVVGLLPAALVAGEGLSVAEAGLVGVVVFLVNAPGNLLGAYLLHRGAPLRWVIPAGCAGMAGSVWGGARSGTPGVGAGRLGGRLLVPRRAGPSALFAALAAVSARTGSAGAAIGLVTRGSAVGQLPGPPAVVAVGAAAAPGAAQSALVAGPAGLVAAGAVVLLRGERIS